MNEQNPYQAPASQIADLTNDTELASHAERLAAALIDAFILIVVILPVMFLGGYFEMIFAAAAGGGQPPFTQQLLWGAIGIVIFFLIQGFPLNATGQTWGKRLLKIRIVDLEGRQPPFGRLAGLRYLPMQLLNLIPFVGGLFVLVNVLLIFRSDRRCGHDLIAGTRVVKLK